MRNGGLLSQNLVSSSLWALKVGKDFFRIVLMRILVRFLFKSFKITVFFSFKKEKNYIKERLQFYNAVHAERESLEAFYLRLTGQAVLCSWTIDQEKEVVRDIFIAKMRNKDIQRELCIHPGATPEEALKSALLQGKGAQTASSLQQ